MPFIADTASTIEETINTQLQQVSAAQGIVCPACWTGIQKAACEGAFPRCTDTEMFVPACRENCQKRLAPCAIQAFNSVCDAAQQAMNMLPSLECWTNNETVPDNCTYCGTRNLFNCGQYVGECKLCCV